MRDGAPISVDMSITLQETKINTKTTINKPQDVTVNDLFRDNTALEAGQDIELKAISDGAFDTVGDFFKKGLSDSSDFVYNSDFVSSDFGINSPISPNLAGNVVSSARNIVGG